MASRLVRARAVTVGDVLDGHKLLEARVRLNGLIRRIEHTHTYALTPTAGASRSSTPSSTTACSDRWPPPTSPRRHPHYARHWPPSTGTSTTTSPKRARGTSTFPGGGAGRGI
jgi:hypothetical protein